MGQEHLEGCREGSSTHPCFPPIPGRKHQSYVLVKWYFFVTVLTTTDLKIWLQFVRTDFKTFIFSAKMRTIHSPIHGPHLPASRQPTPCSPPAPHGKRSTEGLNQTFPAQNSDEDQLTTYTNVFQSCGAIKDNKTPPPNGNMEMGTFYFAIFKNQTLHFSSKYASVLFMEKSESQ